MRRQPSYPFGLPDSIPFLFSGGKEGMAYDYTQSGVFKQDFNMTAAEDPGDPIRIILDALSLDREKVAFIDGASVSYFSTPDKASLDITGDIEFIVGIQLVSYASGSPQAIVSKSLSTGNQHGYIIQITGTGAVAIVVTPDGTAASFVSTLTTTLLPSVVSNGEFIWLKASLDVDNGASGRDLSVSYSLQPKDTAIESVTWTAFQNITTAGTTSIYSNTAPLTVSGISNGSSQQMTGQCVRAQVYNGIGGTLVADFDPSQYSGTGATLADGVSGNWTRNGQAFIAGDGYHQVAPSDATRRVVARLPRGGCKNKLGWKGVPSENFSSSAWVKTATANSTIELEDTSAASLQYGLADALPCDGSQANIARISVLKTVSASSFPGIALVSNNSGPNCGITIDTDNGDIINRSGGGISAPLSSSIVEDPDDSNYWLVTIAQTTGASSTEIEFYFFPAVATSLTATWDDSVQGAASATRIHVKATTTLPTYQKVTAAYDVTEENVPSVTYTYGAGTQYSSIFGSKNLTWMHDGTGGNAFMGVIVNKADDGADDVFAASSTGSTVIGFNIGIDDASTAAGNLAVDVSNGSTNIINDAGSASDISRFTPFILDFSYNVSDDPDASARINGTVKYSGDDTGTPSSAAAANDIAIMGGPSGSNILPGYECGGFFINGLTDAQIANTTNYYKNLMGIA